MSALCDDASPATAKNATDDSGAGAAGDDAGGERASSWLSAARRGGRCVVLEDLAGAGPVLVTTARAELNRLLEAVAGQLEFAAAVAPGGARRVLADAAAAESVSGGAAPGPRAQPLSPSRRPARLAPATRRRRLGLPLRLQHLLGLARARGRSHCRPGP